MPLSNLKILRNNMRDNEKAVIVFRFSYKETAYFLAVCLLTDEERKKKETQYALVRLCFIRKNNLNEYLDCYANVNGIFAGMTELRVFLGVEYQTDGIEWIKGFTKYLGESIPDNITNMSDQEQRAALQTICRHEGRDPNRIYRSYIFRNGKQNEKQKYRTEYNAQLAAARFYQLYPKYKQDKTISFTFIDDPMFEKNENEILINFESNEQSRNG